MKRILITATGSKIYGNGHISRSLKIYSFLRKKYKSVYFSKKINKKKIKNYNCLIFDLPTYKSFKVKRKKNQKIICLDYNGKSKIDVNFSIFCKSNFAKKNLTSIKNTIIDFNFNPKVKIKKKFILVTLGGGNVLKKSLQVVKQIRKIDKKILIYVALGPFGNFYKKIPPKNTFFLKNSTNFKYYQKFCWFAISNGGLTLKEIISLNKNVYAIPQNKNEMSLCKILKKYYDFNYGNIKNLKIQKFKNTKMNFNGLKRLLSAL